MTGAGAEATSEDPRLAGRLSDKEGIRSSEQFERDVQYCGRRNRFKAPCLGLAA